MMIHIYYILYNNLKKISTTPKIHVKKASADELITVNFQTKYLLNFLPMSIIKSKLQKRIVIT